MSIQTERDPNTVDMFGDEFSANIEQMLAHLGDLDASDLKHLWPMRLVEFYEVIAHTVTKLEGLDDKQTLRLSAALVTAIANHFGGTSFYLPHNEKLEKAVRDIKIFKLHKGDNHTELARQFRLSQQQIYTIVANQTRLRRAKLQPQLDLE